MLISNLELLHHMQDEVDFVLTKTKGKEKEEVLNDAVLCRALIRSLEIIGEVAKKVDAEFKAIYSHIEWRKIAGPRDKLIHDYFGIDYDIVWDIVETKLPDLQFHIKEIFDENDKLPEP
ncbi:MAG: DUF86 domain-containing protein [Bacteroidota bacterium]|nr:DUF86 domain-containing protein [Bacteroidota bacterium]